MTVTQPDETTLARKWKIDVDLSDAMASTWILVKGLNEFQPSPNKATMQDDNAYEDGGYLSRTKTALSWALTLKLVRRTTNPTATTYDVGQERLRHLAETLGPLGVAHVRWYDRNGGLEAYEGFAEVEWDNDGGPIDALEKVTVVLTGKGTRTLITNPDA